MRPIVAAIIVWVVGFSVWALLAIFVIWPDTAASSNEPPAQTIKRLRVENARLRFQNRNLLANIDILFKRIDLLNNEITDCQLNR